MTNQLIAVFIGGGLGSLARFGISLWVTKLQTTLFPLATLTSNLLSCVVLGLIVGFFHEQIAKQSIIYLLLAVGFCGGFSTFSTFSLETYSLIKNGHLSMAISNVLVSVAAGLFVFWVLVKKLA